MKLTNNVIIINGDENTLCSFINKLLYFTLMLFFTADSNGLKINENCIRSSKLNK